MRNHSPTGPAWGYGGLGPAQLALGIPLPVTDEATAERFKRSVIALIEADRSTLDAGDILDRLAKAATATTTLSGVSPTAAAASPSRSSGVVADARVVDLEDDAGLVACVPYWIFRGNRPPSSCERRPIRLALGPRSPRRSRRSTLRRRSHNIRTMDRALPDAIAARRFQLALTVGFAPAGLLLVGLGVYDLVASAVERRRTGVAVRLALGATTRRVFGMAHGHGMRPAVVGAAAGLAAAVAGRAMAALLYEVAPHDWTMLAAATMVVLGVALAACLAPAVRASGPRLRCCPSRNRQQLVAAGGRRGERNALTNPMWTHWGRLPPDTWTFRSRCFREVGCVLVRSSLIPRGRERVYR